MVKNKIKHWIDAQIHGFDVRKNRKLMLNIHYRKGLIEELKHLDETYLDKKTAMIEAYYQEEVKTFQKRIDGLSKIDEKREAAIQSHDQKAYWKRRRLKTSLLRKLTVEETNEKLMIYDQETLEDKKKFMDQIYIKYPKTEMPTDLIKSYQEKIDKRLEIKNKRLEQLRKRYERKHAYYQRFILKNEAFIKKGNEVTEVLSQKISSYYKVKIKEEELLIAGIKEKIKGVESDARKSEKAKEKILSKLSLKLDLIENTIQMIEDPNTHLTVSNLKMYFGGVKAVNDLSFKVKKGEIFGLIGPNGAGKTTVFNCITQFYRSTGGNLLFRNKEHHIVDLNTKKTHDMIHEGIARSFQNVELIWELTVIDNLLVAAHSLLITNFFEHMSHTPKVHREELVLRNKGMQILKSLGIESYAYRSPYGLPYGILKKIELARTLMTEPSLIILDEPAAGLNDSETKDLAKVIKEINQTYGITIFLVEHDMSLVMSICDRVCAISFGKMISLGTPKEIQNDPEVRKAYLGDDSDE